ncbi:universal stress protein [Xanthovirga aplysinae]|uniref:universal stress protein n=1 Tax=Xanthovirga aplysinae TaxID=2529853 RepID=UPI0012BCFE42|nr:universal stress protein [Xanthovirga aplysinae]MTI31198.1 universal stress protein [Xanthovirga aplysinae]
MKKILIPTDFSEEAVYALDFALDLAKKTGVELYLLHVAEYPTSTFSATGEAATNPMDNAYVGQLIERLKKRIKEIINEPRFDQIRISGNVEFGSPYSSISSNIVEQEVDLVIMGSKGVSGLEEILIGSNTEKVVRNAKCPVITIKSPVSASSIKEIAFATSLREEEMQVVNKLKEIQDIFDAHLQVVMINTPNNFMIDRDIRRNMKRFADHHKLKNYSLNIYNDVVEEDGIIYFAEEINADMIAMGTHGRTGLMHLLGGSIAEDVVNHSKRPVWTFNMHA